MAVETSGKNYACGSLRLLQYRTVVVLIIAASSWKQPSKLPCTVNAFETSKWHSEVVN